MKNLNQQSTVWTVYVCVRDNIIVYSVYNLLS